MSQKVNSFNRRGFIGTAIAIGVTALDGTAKVVEGGESISEHDALIFVDNFINAIPTKDGIFCSDKRQILLNVAKFYLDGPPNIYLAQYFTPAGREVLPGWTLDYDARDGHYVLILRGPKFTLVADDSNGGTVYHAWTTGMTPSAKDIAGADRFPGAVPFNIPLQ